MLYSMHYIVYNLLTFVRFTTTLSLTETLNNRHLKATTTREQTAKKIAQRKMFACAHFVHVEFIFRFFSLPIQMQFVVSIYAT